MSTGTGKKHESAEACREGNWDSIGTRRSRITAHWQLPNFSRTIDWKLVLKTSFRCILGPGISQKVIEWPRDQRWTIYCNESPTIVLVFTCSKIQVLAAHLTKQYIIVHLGGKLWRQSYEILIKKNEPRPDVVLWLQFTYYNLNYSNHNLQTCEKSKLQYTPRKWTQLWNAS